MSFKTDDLAERLLKCLKESEDNKADLDTWIGCLEELSEIEDAFEVDKGNKLYGKTILDVGTDCGQLLIFQRNYFLQISRNAYQSFYISC